MHYSLKTVTEILTDTHRSCAPINTLQQHPHISSTPTRDNSDDNSVRPRVDSLWAQ